MNEVTIRGRKIGEGHPPFVIAELSGNHNQSLERALAIVDAAAQTGVHALKIQTYDADTMTLDVDRPEFFIRDPKSLWNGYSLHKLYQEAYTPREWHKPIFDRCEQHGMIGFSTPFDATAVEFLESLNVPMYKVASFEITDLPLIRKIARTGKPILMSTGMATEEEMAEALAVVRAEGCADVALLKCTSTYPATPQNTNLLTIADMRKRFGCQIGLSDHTIGIGVAVAAVGLGATVVEKHFTLARADGGVDSAFSMEPAEMAALVTEAIRAWQALGRISYGPTESEKASLQFRRSIYVVADLRAGDVLTEKHLRIVRPSVGLAPRHFEDVLGRRVTKDVSRGTPLTWDLLA
jgi:N-acetylneuraminate synthase